MPQVKAECWPGLPTILYCLRKGHVQPIPRTSSGSTTIEMIMLVYVQAQAQRAVFTALLAVGVREKR